MEAENCSAFQAVEKDRLRVLDAFRSAISRPISAAEVALPTLQEALHPQTVLNSEENQLLENGLRALLQDIVASAVAADEPVMQFGAGSGGGAASADEAGGPHAASGLMTRLLDLTLHLCEQQHSEAGIVFQLLEDLTEISTVSDCKQVFGYIESKQEVLGKAELLGRGKLVLLRACNQLLRRLSKVANDVVFCGRILMFLSHFFPMSERSAANIKGNYNTANKTEYQREAPREPLGPPLDFKFYTTFWALQEYFSNPPTVLQANRWPHFTADLLAVLEVLESQPIAAEEGTGGLQADDARYNTKFLTSPALLGLELKDCNFRRHVLLQCLILFDFLKAPLRTEKDDKRDAVREEVGRLEARVAELLLTIPPRAHSFAAAIQHLFARERNWVQWKRDGCPPFDKPPEKKRALEKTLERWALQNPNALTDRERVRVPTVREYFKDLARDLDPEEGIEADYSKSSDKVYCWRGLRLAARQDIEAFGRFGDMGIEGVVPPDLLPESVKNRLYPAKQPVAAKPKAPARKDAPQQQAPTQPTNSNSQGQAQQRLNGLRKRQVAMQHRQQQGRQRLLLLIIMLMSWRQRGLLIHLLWLRTR
eukprot:jgi/Mesen1/9873/ME000070S09156